MKTSKPANMNTAWAEIMVRELERLGVDTYFVAPGSRSTPLALAIADHGSNLVMHFDERGVGFAALGYARAAGKPAVVVTTSGSAVANLWPAICEASIDAVPMIVITADRPPELRDTGANQTMPQSGIFGNYVRWHMDLPCPDQQVSPAFLLSTVDHAYFRSTHIHPGPVHLNQMFREPLTPVRVKDGAATWMGSVGDWWKHQKPWTQYEMSGATQLPPSARTALVGAKRGIIVAGSVSQANETAAIQRIAEALGWPVLPDIRSGLRLIHDHSHIIHMADQLLLSEKLARSLRPDVVLHVGGRITSKRLQQFVARSGATVVMVNGSPSRLDPEHGVTVRVVADLANLEWPTFRAKTPAVWRKKWKQFDRVVTRSWLHETNTSKQLSEPNIAAILSNEIPAHHGLVLASSMPIRDMEMYGQGRHASLTVASNRGVSGIDGNLAMAVGFAEGSRQPVTLVIGDLALLHDLNSLALVQKSPFPVTIVVVNNDGGGIFSFLPVATVKHHYETCFGTPHGLHFADAASMFGLHYARPESTHALRSVFRKALTSQRSSIIEVTTTRSENLREHRRIQSILRQQIDHAR